MELLGKFQIEQGVKQLSSFLPEYKMLCDTITEMMRLYFNSLVKAGFTEEQALRLIEAHGWSPGRVLDAKE